MVTDLQLVEKKEDVEIYSFSKISSWWTCPWGFKLRYIDHEKGEGNAFSSYGTLIHSIMERYAAGEIDLIDLVDVLKWEFDSEVKEEFPPNKYVNLRDTYYKQAVDFLSTFSGYSDCKILGVEEKFNIPIDDWIFTGVIDLVYEDADGRLIIKDYKSKASFKNKSEKKKYARQLYLYSLYVKEKYGRYPDLLKFHMFRKQKMEDIVFDENDLQEAVEWAKKTVKIVRNAQDYPDTCDEFYGEHLCNFRNTCEKKNNQDKESDGWG